MGNLIVLSGEALVIGGDLRLHGAGGCLSGCSKGTVFFVDNHSFAGRGPGLELTNLVHPDGLAVIFGQVDIELGLDKGFEAEATQCRFWERG